MSGRVWAGEPDLVRMRRLVQDSWRLVGPRFEWAVGDLSWRFFRFPSPRLAETIRLFEDEAGALQAFTWFYERTGFDVAIHPCAPPAIYSAVIEAGLEGVWVLESNTRLNAALTAAGYEPGGTGYVHLARTLEAPVGPQLRHRTRAVRGVAEAAARASLHRRAFGSNRVTTESYLALMQSPGYRPELDLVAVDDADRMVAFALAWLDEVNAAGELEPVGTDPDHRRSGLARAVCTAALDALYAHGAKTAIIYADEKAPHTIELYRSLGFEQIDRNRRWTKTTGT